MHRPLAILLALALASTVAAQTAAPAESTSGGAGAAYAAELAAINARMHAGMAMESTGDPDTDFVLGMIPHHQAAVDMARLVLDHGDDAAVREMAEAVIATQEAEIAWMMDWLAANAPEAGN